MSTRYFKLWLFIFPFFLFTVSYCLKSKSPFYIVNEKGEDSLQTIKLSSVTDQIQNGNSEITIIQNKFNRLNFKYTLKEGHQYRYASVSYNAPEEALFDLSHYDYAKINIRSSRGKRITFCLWTQVEGYTDPHQKLSHRPSGYVMNTDNEFREITIPFKDLFTSGWWYTENNKTEQDFGNPDFSKVSAIDIANCLNIEANTEDTVTVRELSFHVNLVPFYILFVCLSSVYYLILFYFLKPNKNKHKKIDFQYDQIFSYEKDWNEEEKTVFNYVLSNYALPDLSITDINKVTGISERKVSDIMKHKTGVHFKHFLNQLRLTEAKRLLLETDLHVSELAFKVGYKSTSHFSRAFKAFEKCSPTDYRKNLLAHSTKRA